MSLTPPAAAPRPLVISYWLYLVGAALGLIGLIVTLVLLPAQLDAVNTQLRAGSSTVPAGAVQAGVIFGVVLSTILSVAYIVVFVIFDRLMVRGRNWARIVLAVLAGLQIFGVLGAVGIGALHFLVLLVALIFSFLPESNAYFQLNRAAPPVL